MTTTDRERAADIDTIVATMVERIADGFDPERILLFGSRARGDAKDWSDVDLLVVMPDGTDRREAAVEMGVAVGDLPDRQGHRRHDACPHRAARPRHRHGAAAGAARRQGPL